MTEIFLISTLNLVDPTIRQYLTATGGWTFSVDEAADQLSYPNAISVIKGLSSGIYQIEKFFKKS